MHRAAILPLINALLAVPTIVACDVAKHEKTTSVEPEDVEETPEEETEPAAEEERPGEQTPVDGPGAGDWPAEAEACDGEATRACRLASGEEGVEVCMLEGGAPVWTACLDLIEIGCMPGESWDQGCIGGYCTFDGEGFEYFGWQTDPECNTPLVLDFGGDLRFDAAASGASFDFAAATSVCQTDWPTAPWLALDRDRSGSIDSGRELFGSGTRLASGRRAAHGFEALAELDADGDGTLTAADPRFAELVLWTDHDADRAGDLAELVPAADVGLVAIHLDYHRRGACDARGNCGLERASFEYRAATGERRIGEVVDVYLACQ